MVQSGIIWNIGLGLIKSMEPDRRFSFQ
jgi:hypothetical protein